VHPSWGTRCVVADIGSIDSTEEEIMSVRIARWASIGVGGVLLFSNLATAAFAQQSAPMIQAANNPGYGSILVNAQGMTLYELTSEVGGKFHCSGQCLTFWPPITLPSGTTAPTVAPGITGTFGSVARPDGSLQATDNGYPLYLFVNDKAAGDTKGNGIQAFGGTWHVVQASAIPLAATAVERLAIHITATSSTVWGNVTVRYTYNHQHIVRLCGGASCVFLIPFGATVHLSQSPTDKMTWPFQRWQIRGLLGQSQPASLITPTVSLHMTTSYRVKVVYTIG
jgi:predicted lipoprotein with Yx(FWY)xxD motif